MDLGLAPHPLGAGASVSSLRALEAMCLISPPFTNYKLHYLASRAASAA